jgi:hypothetical protein
MSCSFDALKDARYEFTFADAHGIGPAEPLRLEVHAVPDRAPQVELEAVGIGGMVLPGARVPVRVKAKDDYGVARAWLEQRYEGADGDVRYPPVEVHRGPVSLSVAAERVIELSELSLPPRGRFVVSAVAEDACALGGPNKGTSPALALRLVTVRELLDELLVQQRDLRTDLEQQIARQQDVRAQVTGLAEGRPVDAAQLERLERAQASCGPVLGHTATAYGAILDQLQNNGLMPQLSHDARTASIVEPLRHLGRPEGPLRRAIAVLGTGEGAAGDAAALLSAGLAEMERVRAGMMLLEDYTSLVASVNEISQQESDLLRRTDEMKQKALEELLGRP